MKLANTNGVWVLDTDAYQLKFHTARPYVDLKTPEGERIVELFALSSVHPMNGRDDTYQIGTWSFQESPDEIVVTLQAKSTAWINKTYTFHCLPQRLTYAITVEGKGTLADIHYFGGYSSESVRWSSGFFWSGSGFQQIFNPEPNLLEIFILPASSNSKIDMTGVPVPARADWFFTPPPFCFAGQYKDGWLAMGVEAQSGKNTYTEYQYHGSMEAFYLTLTYEGHTEVNGVYELPAIGFDFASDEYAALATHVTALRQAKLVPVPQVEQTPRWWHEPIFCGWGPQCYLANVDKGHAPSYSRRVHYEAFLKVLDQQQIDPGVVVLDDKWQATYGDNTVDEDKWPDLRGFIDQQHALGRKVLLWLKAWDPEGVPLEECVTNAGGKAIALDITHPAYEARLRAAVQRMLSSDGYNADGFKIDFTARIPSGYGLSQYDNSLWGLELMRKYLSVLHSEAKSIKSDALIMAHTPHPYLADVLDMIRLNDINTWPNKDINRAMRHRAKVARVACPEAIIDTDNWPVIDRKSWREYLEIQAELGVPSLYAVTHIDSTQEPLEAEDYALIRQVWARYRAQNKASQG